VKKFNTKVIISISRDEIFSCFGVPETVVSDNGTQFTYIRSDQREWDVFLSSINCYLRNSIHQSIGISPYNVVFGKHMISHGNDYKLLRKLNLLAEGDVKLSRTDEFQRIRSNIAKHLNKAY